MIDEVMYEIREMTGQTYKNVYAGEAETADAPKPSRVASVADGEATSGERELVAVAG
jgi:hypothetical protein